MLTKKQSSRFLLTGAVLAAGLLGASPKADAKNKSKMPAPPAAEPGRFGEYQTRYCDPAGLTGASDDPCKKQVATRAAAVTADIAADPVIIQPDGVLPDAVLREMLRQLSEPVVPPPIPPEDGARGPQEIMRRHGVTARMSVLVPSRSAAWAEPEDKAPAAATAPAAAPCAEISGRVKKSVDESLARAGVKVTGTEGRVYALIPQNEKTCDVRIQPTPTPLPEGKYSADKGQCAKTAPVVQKAMDQALTGISLTKIFQAPGGMQILYQTTDGTSCVTSWQAKVPPASPPSLSK